jgi:hypothetical protein
MMSSSLLSGDYDGVTHSMALDQRGSNRTVMLLKRRVTGLTDNHLGCSTAVTKIDVRADLDYHALHIERLVNIRSKPISREGRPLEEVGYRKCIGES